jgi:hypothetical protein
MSCLMEYAARVRLAKPPERELPEYIAFARRVVRGAVKRFLVLEEGDLEDLAELAALADEVNAAVAEVVRGANSTRRWSWTDVGRAMGITRQSAWERWGR